jgi:hypothetical protein
MPMKLSDREKELIKELMMRAKKEGGTKLQFLVKKFIIATYWYHKTAMFKDYSGTVGATILRAFPNNNKYTIQEALRREIYSIPYWVSDLYDDAPDLYNGISTNVMLDTNTRSMKTFMADIIKLIHERETNVKWAKIVGLYQQPVEGLPF